MIDVRQMLIDYDRRAVLAGDPTKMCARCGAACSDQLVWPAPEIPDDPCREACILCAESEELGLWLAARDKAMRPWP